MGNINVLRNRSSKHEVFAIKYPTLTSPGGIFGKYLFNIFVVPIVIMRVLILQAKSLRVIIKLL